MNAKIYRVQEDAWIAEEAAEKAREEVKGSCLVLVIE
jgi:hypothetical protein